MDIKTSSPDTWSLRVHVRMCELQQKMTLSWQQVLSHKYQYKYQYPKIVLKYRSSTSTSTQYNKTESDCKHSDCFRYSNAPLIRLRHTSRGAVAVRL